MCVLTGQAPDARGTRALQLQEEFDDAVKTNIEDFDMSVSLGHAA